MKKSFEKLIAETFFDEAADHADTKVYKLNDAMIQKFGELIVRECMDLVKDCYAEPGIDQSPYQTVCASTIIEEYFKFEE